MGVSHPDSLPLTNTTETQERVVDNIEKGSLDSKEKGEVKVPEIPKQKLTWSDIVKSGAGSERPAIWSK